MTNLLNNTGEFYHRPYLFKGKNALVTGGAKGIGKAVALMLAKNGATVVVADIEEKNGCKVVEEIEQLGGSAYFKLVNISSADDIKELVEFMLEKCRHIHILVNCAGVTTTTGIFDITEQEWDYIMNINLKGMFMICQRVLQQMVENNIAGSIVNISSLAGEVGGLVVSAPYAASKAGVIALTKTLARFAAKYGINVNAVAPGMVKTDMLDNFSEEQRESLFKNVPLKRVAKPEEVAALVNFLVSPEASYITGETVNINGGIFMK